MKKIESGIWIRVGKENKLLENMHPTDRREWLLNLTPEGLIRTIEILCWAIKKKNNE